MKLFSLLGVIRDVEFIVKDCDSLEYLFSGAHHCPEDDFEFYDSGCDIYFDCIVTDIFNIFCGQLWIFIHVPKLDGADCDE